MATPQVTHFELIGADGGPLRGDVRRAPRSVAGPAVVICHGFKGFKDWGFFPKLADRLARAGFAAVSFNFSGSGVGPDGEHFTEPDRFGHATYASDLKDLATVIDAIHGGTLVTGMSSPASLGLFGHSRGGGAVVLRAGGRTDEAVNAMVTWSAIGKAFRWGPETIRQWRETGKLDITNMRTGEVLPLYTDLLDEVEGDWEGRFDLPAAASRVRVPWLMVHGEADEAVPVSEGRMLWEQTERRATFMPIAHGSHTYGAKHPWAGTTMELDRAMEATVNWFVRYLF
ncbi:MAG TPA: alpha/beta fold hydrolase [Gemmatimonadales bacterium]